MKARVIAWALACAAFAALPAQAQRASEADALHVLNRLGYGPAPGDLAHVRQVGIDRYIDEQLHPERLPLPADLAQQLAALPTAAASQRELITQYREAAQAVKDGGDEARAARHEALRQLDIESGQARLWRAARSPRQLEERDGGLLVQPLQRLRRQGPGPGAGRQLRARGDPALRDGPLPRPAGGHGPSPGDAVLPGQLAVRGRGLAAARRRRPRRQGQRPERELRPRADGAAHAGRRWRLHPAGRDRAGRAC